MMHGGGRKEMKNIFFLSFRKTKASLIRESYRWRYPTFETFIGDLCFHLQWKEEVKMEQSDATLYALYFQVEEENIWKKLV